MCLIREEKEREPWSLASDLRRLVSGRKDACSGWLQGRHGGRANSGEPRAVHARPPPQASVFPLMWKERLMSLSLQLSKYFCFPFPSRSQLLLQPALRAFRAMALSCGWRSARPPSPDGPRAETAGPRSEGTADVLSLSSGPHPLDDRHGPQGLRSSPFSM